MKKSTFQLTKLAFALFPLFVAGMAAAQADDPNDQGQYKPRLESPDEAQSVEKDDSGPVRLLRITQIEGKVSWRADGSLEWSDATANLPLRQGAQVYVEAGSHAELQMDDGSYIRLGDRALLVFDSLYSDKDGEFTEIRQTDGRAYYHLRTKKSLYQINTPLVSMKATGAGLFRVDSGDQTQVSVFKGKVKVEGDGEEEDDAYELDTDVDDNEGGKKPGVPLSTPNTGTAAN